MDQTHNQAPQLVHSINHMVSQSHACSDSRQWCNTSRSVTRQSLRHVQQLQPVSLETYSMSSLLALLLFVYLSCKFKHTSQCAARRCIRLTNAMQRSEKLSAISEMHAQERISYLDRCQLSGGSQHPLAKCLSWTSLITI